MRRVICILLFVLGGWMLMTELVVAFFDAMPGLGDNAGIIGLFVAITVVPLLLGAWTSPGARWQELGLTILLATGAGLFCGAAAVAVFLDPGSRPFMPPMPKIELAPVIGTVNMLVVAALGWWLYRRKPDRQLERIFGDE